MQISLNWLNDYVDVRDMSPEDIGVALTDIGLAVDGVATVSKIPSTVVVGRVLTAKPHPNADSLRVCTVDVGGPAPLDIVCGASNAREGIFVSVALVGTDFGGGFKIKEAKIRGEKSCGMMCSEKELGLSDAHEGIIELKGAPTPGQPAAAVLGSGDTVFTLDITANRGDCLSHIGVARDLAARLKRPLRLPGKLNAPAGTTVSKGVISVRSDDVDGCARFVGLYIKNVAVVPSPAWMQARLDAAGMRPINLVVDVTNYVMLEYGLPIHAYDERDVKGMTLVARAANEGEKVQTLDGQTRQMMAGELLICDGERAVGIAGIMGGANSEVKSDTRNIIVEVAWFNPLTIRKTSKRLALRSEASKRFERSVDITACAAVARRVGDLLVQCTRELIAAGNKELTEPSPATDLVDFYPQPVNPAVITLRLSRAREILAQPTLKKEMVKDTLEGLQIRMIDSNEERLVFEIPSWRHDIEREVDLIEELARLIGLEKIPYSLPTMSIRPTPEDLFIDFIENARVALAQAGFRETVSFPFLSKAEMTRCNIDEHHPLYAHLSLANPLSEEFALMQTTLAPNMIKTVVSNLNHGQKAIKIFECGRGYYDFAVNSIDKHKYPLWSSLDRPGRHLTARARSDKHRTVERHLIAGIIGQPWIEKSWNAPETAAGFYFGKESACRWLKAFGVSAPTFRPIPAESLPWLHPGAAAVVYINDTFVGYVGEVHPKTAIAFGLAADDAPVLMEFDLEAVFEARTTAARIESTMWRFPPAARDLAFIVDRKITHADFEAAISTFPKRKNLQRAAVFDLYEGGNIPPDRKSLAYTFDFQSAERTLTDQEVEAEVSALSAWLSEKLGATLRG